MRYRSRRRGTPVDTEGPGQDSFLDIVTNIVGILIILVMVIGVKTKDAWVKAAVAKTNSTANETQKKQTASSQKTPSKNDVTDIKQSKQPAEKIDVETPLIAAKAVEEDIHNITTRIHTLQREAMARFQQRGDLQLLTTLAERALKERREKLDANARAQVEANRQLLAADEALADLSRQRKAIENRKPKVKVIEHHPTPLAKTVFGQEVHYRLLNGRIVRVPLNRLVERLKKDAQRNVWKLKNSPQITETIGPIDGFLMKYTIKMVTSTIHNGAGQFQRTAPQLDRFILVPVMDDLGEPIAEALRPDSFFFRSLQQSQRNHQQTTITIWVYPDSFREFRIIKKELDAKGFAVAGRPLPTGEPIGGSPSGSRSSAQ